MAAFSAASWLPQNMYAFRPTAKGRIAFSTPLSKCCDNLAENAIRPITLGRKNYLFAGSNRGAEQAAMMYSFFATSKKNDVNPYQWLKKILEVIPTYKVNRLTDLLPQNLEV